MGVFLPSPSESFSADAPLSLVCAQASDPEMISQYFDLLERIHENESNKKPGQVFNMDESGMPLDPTAPKVVVERGSAAIIVGSGNETIVGCDSAAGFRMPPMVM